MDQSDLNLIKMLQQAFLTGGVGPLDQSPDLPTLGFSSMRQSAGLSPYPANASTHIKTPTPDQLIREIIEGRQGSRGKPSSAVNAPTSRLLQTALGHVPVDWKGRRQSENVEDVGTRDKYALDLNKVFNWALKHGVGRTLFPEFPQSDAARLGYTNRPPTPFAPTQDVLERLVMSDPKFWTPLADDYSDYPDLGAILDDQ